MAKGGVILPIKRRSPSPFRGGWNDDGEGTYGSQGD